MKDFKNVNSPKNVAEKESKFKSGLKKYKDIVLGIAFAIVGTVIIKCQVCDKSNLFENDLTDDVMSMNEENIKKNAFEDEICANLTGKKYNARDLGRKVGLSAQKINKKIEEAGFSKSYGNNKYLTDTGKLIGEHTYKVTKDGFEFSNIEWDESILNYIDI